MKKLIKNLGVWILIAMVAGVAAGVAMGEKATMFAPFGTLFIQLIKMLVVPLVAVSIISGVISCRTSDIAQPFLVRRRIGLPTGADSSFISSSITVPSFLFPIPCSLSCSEGSVSTP